MSAEMYSTAPSTMGGLLIVGTAWMASRPAPPEASASVWPYVLVAAAYFFFAFALTITGSMQGNAGLLRVCSVLGAVPSALAGWWLWKTRYFPLAVICLAAGAAVLLWGWIAAWIDDRHAREAADGPGAPPTSGPSP